MAHVHIGSGRTTPGSTAWVAYGTTGIYLDVSTAGQHFASTPTYLTSIGGTTNHWSTTGATSIYLATPTGFRVYVRYIDGGAITPAQANAMQWHINWIGMEV